ncbi:adiponectin receptor protein [Eurytemora carolleeae]|uniref:adiponectin receptor protein n=1 Tax=Eurytemora carolleeae TaxID=1294199 RepID=UPI000C771CF9|nr:adiponectin receptor protein [Eurytemora carolleeae]|eukprot:XP_023329414.1 adiponectin receptor protein-like [Eurytemora affinis]
MVDDLERIYQEMSSKMSFLAESASAKSNAFVRGSKDIVHRTAQGGASIMTGAARKSGDMAKSAVAAAEKTAKSAAEVPGIMLDKVKHWKVHSFEKLPGWMRDNEFLTFGHRPELNSFRECFKSVFRIHTETGNIWTHFIGFIAFITVTILFYLKPLCEFCNDDIELREKLIFLFFFISAILCLGLSSLFHTVCCHSEWVNNIFSKLDYAGIALLTVGSFIPWIYYGFYCQFTAKVVYLTVISVLGIGAITVTMMDRFNTSDYRPLRAVLFVCLGGFGLVPTVHLFIQNGWSGALVSGGIPWLLLMAFLYITGALLYGARIPERFLPGKFDLWFQSHQIFHVLVIAAAFVHYRGMTNMAVHRLTKAGECENEITDYSIYNLVLE